MIFVILNLYTDEKKKKTLRLSQFITDKEKEIGSSILLWNNLMALRNRILICT